MKIAPSQTSSKENCEDTKGGQPESVNEEVQTIEWQKKKVETLVDKILHRKLMIEPKQTD